MQKRILIIRILRLDDALEHVRDLNEEGRGIVGLREIADCRGITNLDDLTVAGTTRASAAQENKPGSLLALLVRDNDLLLFGMARAFQTFSEDVRHEVKIFKNTEECLDWIDSGDDNKAPLLEFLEQVTQ